MSIPPLPAYWDKSSNVAQAEARDTAKPKLEQATLPAARPTDEPHKHSANDLAKRGRLLRPPYDATLLKAGQQAASPDSHSRMPKFGLPIDSIYTSGTALAIVVGLFLLCAWVLRRGTRKSTKLLSEGVVRVLGRVPLAARQFAQLVHVGNKIVLLSVTSTGVETLTEITDPVEIDRVLGLCQQQDAHSSTSEFDQVFRKLAKESAPDGFLDDATTPLTARTTADAYAAYRGGSNGG